jgi:N-methylhydantoinase B/oxoprolinase/acetone carboxylase alpha subunit
MKRGSRSCGGDEAASEHLEDKCTIKLVSGDVVRVLTPGGGDYETPSEA